MTREVRETVTLYQCGECQRKYHEQHRATECEKRDAELRREYGWVTVGSNVRVWLDQFHYSMDGTVLKVTPHCRIPNLGERFLVGFTNGKRKWTSDPRRPEKG